MEGVGDTGVIRKRLLPMKRQRENAYQSTAKQ